MTLLFSMVFGTVGYFTGVKTVKTSCEKHGYFMYVDKDGNKEDIECKK